MRKLASIQRIIDVQPIPGADAIEVCSVLGWKVVTRKGEFKPGILCVYIEIDSLLPRAPWNEFLWKKGDEDKPVYRLRTIKLRGQISQGLVLPISVLDGKKFPTDTRENPIYPRKEGMNVSAMLGITKYEPPIPAQLAGLVKGQFPCFIPKTDETRIQAAPEVLKELNGKMVYASVKMDGSSGTFYFNRGEFGVCSRNLEFKLEDNNNTFIKLAIQYDLENKMKALGKNIAIQGEVCGEGIQKNRLCLKGHELFVFNVYDIDKGAYLDYKDAFDIVVKLGLKSVPIMDTFAIDETFSVEKLLEMAKGNYPGTSNPREGIVIRTVNESYSASLKGRMSFKVINNEFLMKGGD